MAALWIALTSGCVGEVIPGTRSDVAVSDRAEVSDATALDADRDDALHVADSLAHDTADAVDAPALSCATVTCSGHGRCVLGDGGVPACRCSSGYLPSGLDCVPDPCVGMSCPGRCAQCVVVAGTARCGCGTGWRSDGRGGCTPDPSPCEPDPCAANQVCVTEIHCVPSGVCLQGCDCSNCGNCSSISSNTNCGSSDGGLPAIMCTTPCAPGEGCIPTGLGGARWGMCYGGEGCFSR